MKLLLKGIKCALSVMEICNGYMAHPLRKFIGHERELIKLYVKEFTKVSVL